MGRSRDWNMNLSTWPFIRRGPSFHRTPLTKVKVTRGFWMGETEVTQKQYVDVMGHNPSKHAGDMNRPVEQVSWSDATNYCFQLNLRERTAGRLPEGYQYRLPTEAEWEYACRAGSSTDFCYGNDSTYAKLTQYAWYRTNTVGTQPVGLKRPNKWGIYGMHGNVAEWCLDSHYDYSGRTERDPYGRASDYYRTVRGGQYFSTGDYCVSSIRRPTIITERNPSVGFRIILAESIGELDKYFTLKTKGWRPPV